MFNFSLETKLSHAEPFQKKRPVFISPFKRSVFQTTNPLAGLGMLVVPKSILGKRTPLLVAWISKILDSSGSVVPIPISAEICIEKNWIRSVGIY